MNPETPGDLLELAYPYALDAVSEFERRAIDHRVRDADARTAQQFDDIVREVRATMVALTVFDAVAPPDRLEAAILAEIDRVRAGQAQRTDTAPRARSTRWRWLVAAAAVVLIAVAVTVVTVVVRQASDHTTPSITAERVLEQPDARARSAAVTGGGTVTVNSSAHLNAAVVTFDGLVAPPGGRAYQLWLVPPAGAPRSAAVLATPPIGSGVLVTGLAPTDTVAMTVEPAGGSRQPTTTPILAIPPA